MSPDVVLRPACPADADRMHALVDAAFAHYVERIGGPPAPMSADFAALAASGDATLAWRADTLVGMVVVTVGDEAVQVDDLAVAPGAQGTGLGARLLRVAEEVAAAEGRSVVRLFTNERMTENLAYYPRRGFVETGRRTEDGFHRVYFEKRLD